MSRSKEKERQSQGLSSDPVHLSTGFSLVRRTDLQYNALHAPLHFINWGSLLMGVIFLVTGNYLPKCRQNYTIGIKLPWTLDDEENWNYTHRLAGKLWMIGGVLIILLGFQTVVPSMAVSMTIMVVVTMIPAIASYLYYKKH